MNVCEWMHAGPKTVNESEQKDARKKERGGRWDP